MYFRGQPWGTITETPSGIFLVEDSERPPLDSNGVQFRVWELRGDETKEDLIAHGMFTEESYERACARNRIRLILMGGRKQEDGNWRVENERAVWVYHEWKMDYPFSTYSKAAMESLLASKPSPVQETE